MPIVECLFLEPAHVKVHTSGEYVLMTMSLRQRQSNMLRIHCQTQNKFSLFAGIQRCQLIAITIIRHSKPKWPHHLILSFFFCFGYKNSSFVSTRKIL